MNATPNTLRERHELLQERIARAAQHAGRRPEDIITVAVTKYAELDDVRRIVDLGQRDLAESQAQQLAQRAELFEELRRRSAQHRAVASAGHQLFANTPEATDEPEPVRWHMVGHLQRNKVKKCLPAVRLIHSVDSLRLVEEINAVAIRKDIDTEVLVQVNTTGEKQKSGCPVGAAQHLCEQIDSLVHVHVRGLMVMGPTSQDEQETRTAFSRASELFEDIRDAGTAEGRFNILSMGMSNDLELAIEHGSNLLRIGSALFGPRPAPEPAPEDAEVPQHADHD